MRQVEGSYGQIIGLARRQVRKTEGTFTIRNIFEPLKRKPGVVLSSVVRAVRRLRHTREVLLVEKGVGGREMLLQRQGSRPFGFSGAITPNGRGAFCAVKRSTFPLALTDRRPLQF